MMVGRHGFNIGAECAPKSRQYVNGGGLGLLRWSENAPAADEEFGEERLAQVLVGLRGQNAESIIQSVNEQVQEFTAGAPPPDDITLVVAKLLVS